MLFLISFTELIELSDCYTFTFDTSLYELCLRSASDLAQEPVVSQILPSTIVYVKISFLLFIF